MYKTSTLLDYFDYQSVCYQNDSTDMMKVKTNKIILELTKACKNTMFQKPKHLRSGIFLMHLKLYKWSFSVSVPTLTGSRRKKPK